MVTHSSMVIIFSSQSLRIKRIFKICFDFQGGQFSVGKRGQFSVGINISPFPFDLERENHLFGNDHFRSQEVKRIAKFSGLKYIFNPVEPLMSSSMIIITILPHVNSIRVISYKNILS